MIRPLVALSLLSLVACGPGDPQARPTPTPTIVAGGADQSPEEETGLTGEKWEGRWDSDESFPGRQGEAHGTFTMRVDAEGNLSGRGTYERTNCEVSLTDQGFLIEGQKTDSAFHIVIPGGIGGTPEFDAPIEDGTASGTWEAPYQTWVINLTCKTNCPQSAER